MEAIIGLIGVIVGACLTGVLDSVRARVDARRYAKHSARIVFLEVSEAAAALTAIAQRDDHGVSPDDLDLLVTTWREHRGALVVGVGTPDLGNVSALFALVRRVSSLLRQAELSAASRNELTATAREVAAQAGACLEGIPEALEPLALSRREIKAGETLRAVYEIPEPGRR